MSEDNPYFNPQAEARALAARPDTSQASPQVAAHDSPTVTLHRTEVNPPPIIVGRRQIDQNRSLTFDEIEAEVRRQVQERKQQPDYVPEPADVPSRDPHEVTPTFVRWQNTIKEAGRWLGNIQLRRRPAPTNQPATPPPAEAAPVAQTPAPTPLLDAARVAHDAKLAAPATKDIFRRIRQFGTKAPSETTRESNADTQQIPASQVLEAVTPSAVPTYEPGAARRARELYQQRIASEQSVVTSPQSEPPVETNLTGVFQANEQEITVPNLDSTQIQPQPVANNNLNDEQPDTIVDQPPAFIGPQTDVAGNVMDRLRQRREQPHREKTQADLELEQQVNLLADVKQFDEQTDEALSKKVPKLLNRLAAKPTPFKDMPLWLQMAAPKNGVHPDLQRRMESLPTRSLDFPASQSISEPDKIEDKASQAAAVLSETRPASSIAQRSETNRDDENPEWRPAGFTAFMAELSSRLENLRRQRSEYQANAQGADLTDSPEHRSLEQSLFVAEQEESAVQTILTEIQNIQQVLQQERRPISSDERNLLGYLQIALRETIAQIKQSRESSTQIEEGAAQTNRGMELIQAEAAALPAEVPLPSISRGIETKVKRLQLFVAKLRNETADRVDKSIGDSLARIRALRQSVAESMYRAYANDTQLAINALEDTINRNANKRLALNQEINNLETSITAEARTTGILDQTEIDNLVTTATASLVQREANLAQRATELNIVLGNFATLLELDLKNAALAKAEADKRRQNVEWFKGTRVRLRKLIEAA